MKDAKVAVCDSQLRVIWVETKEDLVLEVHAPPWNLVGKIFNLKLSCYKVTTQHDFLSSRKAFVQ